MSDSIHVRSALLGKILICGERRAATERLATSPKLSKSFKCSTVLFQRSYQPMICLWPSLLLHRYLLGIGRFLPPTSLQHVRTLNTVVQWVYAIDVVEPLSSMSIESFRGGKEIISTSSKALVETLSTGL